MTEDIDAFLTLAERHAVSLEMLRQCLVPLKGTEVYMTELQLQTYVRLRKTVEDHDRMLRARAMSFSCPSVLRGGAIPSGQ